MISHQLAHKIGLEVTCPTEGISGDYPTENKSGEKIWITGVSTGEITCHGTNWKEVQWIVCKNMDASLILGSDTWGFLMTINSTPWNDYATNCGAHLSFLDYGPNGEPKYCCQRCEWEKEDNRRWRAEREEAEKSSVPAINVKQILFEKGTELAKRNSAAVVTLAANMPRGWKTRAYTKRRKEGNDPECQELHIEAEGPSRPEDAMKGVGSLGRITVKGIC